MTLTEIADDKAFDRHGKKPFPSRKAHTNAVRRELWSMGIIAVGAEYDEAGNCRYCGEAGRCPGVHAEAEASKNTSLGG